MKIEKQLEHATTLLERNITWISHNDAKAAGVLAFQAGFFIFLATHTAVLTAALKTDNPTVLEYLFFLGLINFGFFLSKSAYFSFKVLLPQMSNTKISHIYFRHISQMDTDRFISSYKQLDTEDLLNETLSQVVTTSKIVTTKYQAVSAAIRNLKYSSLFWLVIIVLSAYFENL